LEALSLLLLSVFRFGGDIGLSALLLGARQIIYEYYNEQRCLIVEFCFQIKSCIILLRYWVWTRGSVLQGWPGAAVKS
jgi:hypothetical protein